MKLALVLFVFIAQTSFATTTIGEGAQKKDLVEVSDLLNTPQKYLGKMVTVEGTVVTVCKRSGCKMFLSSDKKYSSLMIKSKSKKMIFPLSARGKIALARGTFSRVAKKDHEHKNCDEKDKYSYLVEAIGVQILD